IARIYDGGTTPEGSSYLVMEYVEGKDILAYAREHQLDPKARLRLFLKIAKATSFAHQNLILHRDIKPSNILMGADHEPRLLDFGIAKLMDAGPSPLETQTQVFTPEYASPEQVAGAPLNTSSDIYQLGLLLYELITGKRAHSLQGKTLLERQRIILEEIPALPSTQLAGSPDARFVKGDMDEVIMACLRKEASKRYQDVGDLIQDLEAILENEPISLKAQDWQYRSFKFIQRNRLGIGLLSLAMLFLVGGIFFTARENQKAQAALLQQKEALERESAVSSFLKSLFLAKDPYGLLTKVKGDSVGRLGSVEATMDRMVPLFISRFEENPSLQKQLLHIAVDYYRKLESYDKAASVLSSLSELCTNLENCDPADRVRISKLYAICKYSTADFQRADSAFQVALQMTAELPATPYFRAVEALLLIDYAEYRSLKGDVSYADSLFTRAFSLYNSHTDSLLARSLNYEISTLFLAWSKVKSNLGDYQRAIQLADTALRLEQVRYGKEDFSNVKYLYQIGSQYMYLQAWDSSERYLREGIRLYQRVEKEPDWLILSLQNDLANTLGGQKKYAEQRDLIRETLSLKQQTYGENHTYNAPSWLSLGHANLLLEHYPEAESAYQRALQINQLGLPRGHQDIGACYLALGNLHLTTANYRKAETQILRGLEEVASTLPEHHRVVAFGRMYLGKALFHQGKYVAAEAAFRRCLTAMEDLQMTENVNDIQGYLQKMEQM
ncbi:MAG: protein kinase, partial [Bacteroidota bacterium]